MIYLVAILYAATIGGLAGLGIATLLDPPLSHIVSFLVGCTIGFVCGCAALFLRYGR